MRTKLMAAAAVMGLVAVVLVAGAGPSGADLSGKDATVRVTKVVEGVAPPGTEFLVVVSCENRDPVNLTFPAEGGTMDAVFDPSVDTTRNCSITETPPGNGCDTVAIAPTPVKLIADTEATYPVTVTNTCPEPEAAPAAAAPAAAVPAAPTFTG